MTDLDRITHPLRLAKGTHQRGSGKGCAMNVISYINGDVEITDYPSCTARPLAILVQRCNDWLAGPDGFLSPENSLIVLDLGWRTVGTADVDPSVLHNWLAELLDSEWGVIRFAAPEHVSVIREVADLNRRRARGEDVTACAANVGHATCAAYAAIAAGHAAYAVSAGYAAYAAYAANAHAVPAHAVYAANAAANSAFADAAGAVEFTGKAIECWRTLAGLDNTTPDTAAIDCALAQIAETHS